MSDDFLRLDPADRSKKIDAELLNVGGIDVYRLRVSSVGGAAPGGGLTDLELRATPVPVSGAFWQATQPVSGAFFQATQPVSIAATVQVDVTDEPARQLGIISVSGSVGVTGTFFQATQPVSGTFWQATQPVSGTFWQATQPVSGPATDAQLRATPLPVSGPLTDVQLRATAVPISAPAIVKGTQGANGFTVQNLRDAGRNTRIFMLDAYVVAPVAEAMQSVVQWYNNAAVAGTVQPAVVPAGKFLRLTGWRITYKSTAVFNSAVVRIRANAAGLAVIGSPLVASFETGSGLGATTVAIVGSVSTETGSFPEGIDLPAGAGIGFSMAGYGPTGVLALSGPTRFMVFGYEY